MRLDVTALSYQRVLAQDFAVGDAKCSLRSGSFE
jgi:hypothetical protein